MVTTNSSERRTGILAAAERVFDASGYAATTMETVAAEAGISKGSIYNYFTSKHDLFQQVFAATTAMAEADAAPLLEGSGPAIEKLDKLLDFWSQRLEYHRRIGRLVLEFWATAAREQQGQLAAGLAKDYARWRQRLEGVIAQGIASGEFSPDLLPPVAASLVMAVLDGLMVQAIMGVGVDANAEFLDSLKQAILSLAVRRDGAAPGQR